MPLDDIADCLEDIFDEIEDLFEDFVDVLIGKKTRKRLEKNIEHYGGTMVIATIVSNAFRSWEQEDKKKPDKKSGKVATKPPREENPVPEIKETEIITVTECLRVNMVLAMISAASADGKIDHDELAILEKTISDSQISAKDKAMLTQLLNRPPTLEEVAASAASPLDACELYGAALTVMDEDSPAESLYLRRFATELKIDEDLVTAIDEALN